MGSVGLCCHLPADRGNTAPAGAAGGGWGPAARWTRDSRWGGLPRQGGERPLPESLSTSPLFVLSSRQGTKGKGTWLCPWRVAETPGTPPPQVGAQKPSPKPPVETTQRTVWLGPQHPHQVLPPSRRSSSSFQGFRHSSQSSFLQGALRYRQTEPPRAETPNSALRDIRKCPGVLRSENGPLVPPVQCTDGKKKVTRRVRKAGGRCLASICPQLFNR